MSATLAPEAIRAIRERGGTWAVYRNDVLDSHTAGHVVCLRYGAGCTYPDAPEHMPDTQYGAGWKYRLLGTFDAASLDPLDDSQQPVLVPRAAPGVPHEPA